MKRMPILLLAALAWMISVGYVWARTNYMGYSGAPGSSGTCAGSCHGSGGGTITISGFPQSYTPNQQYLITIRKLSGSSINNFNASCRIGSGSMNAGVIAAGMNTTVYNTAGETNGVHLSGSNRDSAKFIWTAPMAGTGDVRLYLSGMQGRQDTGPNTEIELTSTEAAVLPDIASDPVPSNNAVDVPLYTLLAWTAGANAVSHDVFFGLENPPSFTANQTTTTYDPPGDMLPDTVYYWRIDERNDAGMTTGFVWSFRTAVLPNSSDELFDAVPENMTLGPVYPNPFNTMLTISFALPQAQDISLTAYDILGRQVEILAQGRFTAGIYRFQWNIKKRETGIYFLQLKSREHALTTKVVALK